jgi:hypothetical protein
LIEKIQKLSKASDFMQIFGAKLGNRSSLMNNYNFGSSPQYEAGPSLTDELSMERRGLEAQLNRPDGASTGTLRQILRRYRSLSRWSSLY